MNSPGVSLTAVVLLLIANGFFVAAEFALVKARGFQVAALADKGDRMALLTQRIQENIEPYLAACQLGITMASLGLGWIGEPAVAALIEPAFQRLGLPESMLHQVAFVIGFLLISSLHIVIGEQVPKTMAIRRAVPVSLAIAAPLQVFYIAAWPLTRSLDWMSGKVLVWCGFGDSGGEEVPTREELKGLVTTSHLHGHIALERAEMLHNLLDFDRRNVGRVMIPRHALTLLDINATLKENLAAIAGSGHSRFPLIDSAHDEAILGIVLAKDLHRAALAGEAEPWRDLKRFAREPLIIPASQRVSPLFELMRSQREHMALVVDEYGHLDGIVTLEDLLEEIVGDIEDETDQDSENPAVEVLGEDRWRIDGLLSLADLEREIGLRVPANLDANSVSGLFMQRLARLPRKGDRIVEGRFRLTVQSVRMRRVAGVIVEKLPGNEAPD